MQCTKIEEVRGWEETSCEDAQVGGVRKSIGMTNCRFFASEVSIMVIQVVVKMEEC